jgi:hypothetical protein
MGLWLLTCPSLMRTDRWMRLCILGLSILGRMPPSTFRRRLRLLRRFPGIQWLRLKPCKNGDRSIVARWYIFKQKIPKFMLLVRRNKHLYVNCLQCLAKCCQTIGQKDEKTSTGCRKGAGTLFLYLRATGESKNPKFR